MSDDLVIISGTANPRLTAEICEILGVPIAPCDIDRFSDGEIRVKT